MAENSKAQVLSFSGLLSDFDGTIVESTNGETEDLFTYHLFSTSSTVTNM